VNWSRIKSIFIVAFLILNSFLGYQLWEKQTKKIELAQDYDQSLDELLIHREITLETELSTEQLKMSQLNTQFSLFSFEELSTIKGQSIFLERHRMTSKLNQAYPMSEPWNQGDFEKEVLKEYIVKNDQYKYDRQTSNEIIYQQHIQEYPVFVGTLIFKKNSQGIEGYRQTFYEVVNQGTEQPVISSFTTIRTLLDQQVLPSDSVIKKVTLGYYGQIYDVESQVLTPVWRVHIEQDEKPLFFYVNAYTGALESVPNL
jgi:regulatory protein YycI of two-component signal transduction system YycFG